MLCVDYIIKILEFGLQVDSINDDFSKANF